VRVSLAEPHSAMNLTCSSYICFFRDSTGRSNEIEMLKTFRWPWRWHQSFPVIALQKVPSWLRLGVSVVAS
jgi:hypothetical protein